MGAVAAALIFGFASNVESVLSIIGTPIPSEFMLMVPYVATVIAVSGIVGRVRAPAAAQPRRGRGVARLLIGGARSPARRGASGRPTRVDWLVASPSRR